MPNDPNEGAKFLSMSHPFELSPPNYPCECAPSVYTPKIILISSGLWQCKIQVCCHAMKSSSQKQYDSLYSPPPLTEHTDGVTKLHLVFDAF